MSRANRVDPMHISDVLDELMEPERPGTPTHPNSQPCDYYLPEREQHQMTLTHPRCGKTFPDGSRSGHCSGCCGTFIGLTSFEAHRVGEHGIDRRCELKPYRTTRKEYPHTYVYGHWQDDNGYWHFGERLTEEQKTKMWGKADTHPNEPRTQAHNAGTE